MARESLAPDRDAIYTPKGILEIEGISFVVDGIMELTTKWIHVFSSQTHRFGRSPPFKLCCDA